MTETLYHHGIQGMKWGKRNGPPYPLDYKSHSREEKEKNSRTSLSVYDDNSKKEKTKKEDSKKEVHSSSKTSEFMNSTVSDILGSKAFKTTATVGLVALGTYGAYKLGMASITKAALSTYRTQYLTEILPMSDFKSVAELPLIKGNETVLQAMGKINPEFSNGNAFGYNLNCMFSTNAMVMRMKGYDVTANGSIHGWGANLIDDWYDGTKLVKLNTSSFSKITEKLAEEGNGAYGNFMLKWNKNMGGGEHSIFYYNENGITRFLDTQANIEYNADELAKCIDVKATSWARLDTATPKDSIVGSISKSTGSINKYNEAHIDKLNSFRDNLAKANPEANADTARAEKFAKLLKLREQTNG